jgi:hypothetical protein
VGLVVRALVRLVLAAAVAAALVAVAVGAMYVTTTPASVSLLLEPLSLFLLPGLVVSIVLAGPHDFSPATAMYVTFGFYVVLFYTLLWRLNRPRSIARRGSR